jgi:hypothetical protein
MENQTEIFPPETVPTEDAPAPEPPPEPPPDLVVGIIDVLSAQISRDRETLAQRVTALELFYGFLQSTEDLAVRVAKLEAFSGIPR